MMQHLKQTYTIKTFDVGPLANIIYIITDNKSKESAIIDPAWDMSEVYKYIGENDLILKKILLTHSHHDHVNAIDEILTSYDLEIHINKKEKVFWKKEYDNFVINHGGDTIKLGETEIRSLHTPGHTPGSTCYHIGDDLIAGDTLFVFGCGRCDLHGGSPEEMFNTLKDIKISLDPKTIILPGHNYSIKRESTLQEEIQGNPFMKFNNINKFIDYRMVLHDKVRHSPYGPIEG
jgi:hydroxyacylglutathione hydrolase|tara:strand:- start:508 stop:1206 length:699 start_codon:yes stop_codon:yes gene_type:complete